ncbi:DUF2927 domain-containing protein [uncultured Pelagimonas sp.]|uniref:DUF2927 domain-containing protein n=1 Tax=uncultured Pelagimonas sp. TaxID=1618102 RepID=UPI0026180B31|nr:DUF2927 domain-containing protein [uncultured Pelagimonas sp.]
MALVGCDASTLAPRKTSVTPAVRPTGLVPPPPAPVQPARPTGPSAASKELMDYYARVQNDLLVRGLLRTDGGGPDTAFTDTMLIRNFEQIALAEEYERGAGLTPSSGTPSAVKKWTKPIRMVTEFGAGVPKDQIAEDQARVAAYAARLARITGHPIQMSAQDPNFHVLFMSEDDTSKIAPRIQQLVPDVTPSALRVFDDLPRSIHCLVVAFSDTINGYDYGQAIAIIRSEHPDLLRRSCIHEEIAQGLGLGNDDPRARPSIFNDDDEFALLTTHDEMLLKILYDPRLRPGMTRDQARPVVIERAATLVN